MALQHVPHRTGARGRCAEVCQRCRGSQVNLLPWITHSGFQASTRTTPQICYTLAIDFTTQSRDVGSAAIPSGIVRNRATVSADCVSKPTRIILLSTTL